MNPKYSHLKRKIQIKTALFELANRFQYEYGEYPSYNQFVNTINGVAAQLNESVTPLCFLQNDEYLSEQHIKLLSEQLLNEGIGSWLWHVVAPKILPAIGGAIEKTIVNPVKTLAVTAALHGGVVPAAAEAGEQAVKIAVVDAAKEAVEQVGKKEIVQAAKTAGIAAEKEVVKDAGKASETCYT